MKSPGNGSRTIFFLYSRGVRKFSGDLDLWVQYIDFAKREKAFKKLNEIFTSVVRLHPTKPDIWIHAAHYFMETQADVTNARSYLQRGLRFCKSSEILWLEYAKLETLWIAKIAGRNRILGLDNDRKQKKVEVDPDSGMISLPDITAEDINPSLSKDDDVDQVALQNLENAPVMTGAIPIAVFDAAMKQFQNNPILAERFFDLFAEFDRLPCLERILQHVLEYLKQTFPQTASTTVCELRMQLFGLLPTSPDFPPALRSALGILDSTIDQNPDMKGRLAEVAIRQILPLLRVVEETDEVALKKVLLSSLRKYSRLLEESRAGVNGDAIAELVQLLCREKNFTDAKRLVLASMKQYGANEKLIQFQQLLNT